MPDPAYHPDIQLFFHDERHQLSGKSYGRDSSCNSVRGWVDGSIAASDWILTCWEGFFWCNRMAWPVDRHTHMQLPVKHQCKIICKTHNMGQSGHNIIDPCRANWTVQYLTENHCIPSSLTLFTVEIFVATLFLQTTKDSLKYIVGVRIQI